MYHKIWSISGPPISKNRWAMRQHIAIPLLVIDTEQMGLELLSEGRVIGIQVPNLACTQNVKAHQIEEDVF